MALSLWTLLIAPALAQEVPAERTWMVYGQASYGPSISVFGRDTLDLGSTIRAEVGVAVKSFTVGIAVHRTLYNSMRFEDQEAYGTITVPGDGSSTGFGVAGSFLYPVGIWRLGVHASLGASRWRSPMTDEAYDAFIAAPYGGATLAGTSQVRPWVQAGGRFGLVMRDDAGLVLDIDILQYGALGVETGISLGFAAGF